MTGMAGSECSRSESGRWSALAIAPVDRLSEAAAWFLAERGIKRETLEWFLIGVYAGTGEITIPYPGGTKYRSGVPTGERKFWYSDGFKMSLFNEREVNYPTVFICEGETDTMRLWQEFQDAGSQGVGVVGIPGAQSWKDEWVAQFDPSAQVFVVMDNDADYNVSAQVDASWLKMRRAFGPRAKRIRLPMGVKDVCEYFKKGYGLDDLRTLVAQPVSRYKPLDLRDAHKPRPVDWLVDGLIGHGDIVMAFGEPGVGKSWLSMSLALGVIQGWETWLGQPLRHAPGRVLYIDEENPEDVILERLFKLGLRDGDVANFRYLHEQGIRLDKDPDGVLEEALAFDPTLIVIDSLTRVHTENENDAGAIARLFNDGIKPLARQTGATTMVLHHARKPGSDGSSYSRARGSGDITASVDTGLEIQQSAPGWLQVLHFKSRRRLPGRPINARILDTDDGRVRLVTNAEMPPPL